MLPLSLGTDENPDLQENVDPAQCHLKHENGLQFKWVKSLTRLDPLLGTQGLSDLLDFS